MDRQPLSIYLPCMCTVFTSGLLFSHHLTISSNYLIIGCFIILCLGYFYVYIGGRQRDLFVSFASRHVNYYCLRGVLHVITRGKRLSQGPPMIPNILNLGGCPRMPIGDCHYIPTRVLRVDHIIKIPCTIRDY
ncbi:hypothetical protein F4815DRAFT_405367 [Daldinia loculata]|nr:hypothetical protein F4815DRAFT_405367 [Daldinia loculata]